MMSQTKVMQVTAGAKGPPMVFMGAAQLDSEKWERWRDLK